MTASDEYELGLRDGRLKAIETMQSYQNDRLDHHERRLQTAERIVYGLIGAIALIEIFPVLKAAL